MLWLSLCVRVRAVLWLELGLGSCVRVGLGLCKQLLYLINDTTNLTNY